MSSPVAIIITDADGKAYTVTGATTGTEEFEAPTPVVLCDVNGVALIPSGSSGGAGGTAFNSGAVNNSANTFLNIVANVTALASFYLPYPVAVLNKIAYHITLADATASLYDIGIYGPNCLNGATNVPLVCHTGPQAGSVMFPVNGGVSVLLTGAPVAVNMVPGWYAIAYTTTQTVSSGRMGGDVVPIHDQQFPNMTAPGGSTGVTSGGVLNPTITAPAAGWLQAGALAFSGF